MLSVPSAGDDAAIDAATKELAAHPEALIPLERYFTMESPTPDAPGEARPRSQSAGAGYDVIGELADAQIAGKSIEEVLVRHNLGTLGQADADRRNWLNSRADVLKGE